MTNYVYDGAGILAELDQTGSLTQRYVQGAGIDEPLAINSGGSIAYYEADGLGSITSLTDSSGATANTYAYSSFGGYGSSTGTIAQPFQYTAREVDETGLYYYRTRYYVPYAGSFISEDPIGFDGGNNFYTYALNEPIDFTDPWGLKLCSVKLPGIGDTYIDDSLAPLIKQWISLNAEKGIDLSFTEAFRSTAYQAGLASDPNAITPASPGSSLHEAGFAVDVAWSRIPQKLQPVVVANARLASLNWGGKFTKPDRVHFYHDPGNRKKWIKSAQEDFKKGGACKCSL